jgi:glycosyltransferase involved in cell wall biosynthesis
MPATLAATSREALEQIERERPPRVLHIVENLDGRAVESWLVRMLRHAQDMRVAVDWTFYCALDHPGSMDEQVRALGAGVAHSPVPLSRKRQFARALRAELQRGHYDVIHCHHDLVSAVYLLAATGLPVRKKIVHVHNADEAVPTPSRLKQALFRGPMRQLCLAGADRIVGISNHTLDTFLGGQPRRPERDIVHYYGLDPTPFANAIADRAGFRRECGLPDDALLLLFAGRIVPEKNPVFVVDVLANLRRTQPSAYGIFAGSGSLTETIRERAKILGVENAIRMLGWRNDLPEVMSCSDWFILPHPEKPVEGFGLAVVEAQLAGLRLLLSRGVPDDPLLPTANLRRLPLADGPEVWAKAALELINAPTPSRAAAIAALNTSPMKMDTALRGLLNLYS